ncbi:MAG: hypothetical protein IKD73_08280 [Selenomonadaceae bacterium]|nr:hypothetical protein [Selenomonadaceae bacterium]
MKKKKVLVHGTPDSLQKFFADAVSFDYEVAAILSESFDKVSIVRGGKELDILPSQSLPKFVQRIIDAVIITDSDAKDSVINFFLKQGFNVRKLILWHEADGFGSFEIKSSDNMRIVYVNGLEFHIQNKADENFFNNTLSRFRRIRACRNINPKLYPSVLAQDFQQRRGKPLDFANLQTFTEKMQWIKLYDATPLKSRLADKFLVRSWITEKIGAQYLIPLLGVWDSFDDIDFNALPDQFVLKCNHGSAMNVVVRDKHSFDKQRAREKFNAWLAQDFALLFLELHYTRINRKIIAEKFMQDGDAPDLTDYKFWCFGGKPTYCKVITERTQSPRLDYFDMNWQHMNFEQNNQPNSEHPEQIPPPKNFELMKTLAAKLSEGFAHVRVDFYEIGGRVYFGEMTFTPGAGNFSYKSEGTDEYLGTLLTLPKASPMPRI